MFLPPSPLILLYNDGGRGKEDKNVFPSSSLHPQTLPEIRRARKRKTRKNRGRFFSPSAACRAFYNGKNLEKGPSLPHFSAKFFRSTFFPSFLFAAIAIPKAQDTNDNGGGGPVIACSAAALARSDEADGGEKMSRSLS